MNFYQNKIFLYAIAIFSLLFLVANYYGLKIMNSVYKVDRGNGIVIYADDYVKTGKWVFDCNYSRLISREPLPAPMQEFEDAGKLTIGNMHSLSDNEKNQATSAIRAFMEIDGWYKELQYLNSSLGESNDLNVHVFDLLGHHNGRTWVVKVRQRINQGTSSFKVTAEPYDPETYMDHARMLQAAAKSCPVPQ